MLLPLDQFNGLFIIQVIGFVISYHLVSRPTFVTFQHQHVYIFIILPSPHLLTTHITLDILLDLQQSLSLQVINNLLHTLLHTLQIAPDMDLRALGRLIRRTNACEVLDHTLPRLLIQTLGVARLGDLERQVDVHLDESERLLVGRCGGGVESAGGRAVSDVWGDEGSEGDGGGVSEEFGNLKTR